MFFSVHSSILNLPGESTLRRDFLRLQLANKERSEALRRQQLEQQQRENEEHKRQLLAERQKRIEEQKEQRRRLEEVSTTRATTAASGLAPPGQCTYFLTTSYKKHFPHSQNRAVTSPLHPSMPLSLFFSFFFPLSLFLTILLRHHLSLCWNVLLLNSIDRALTSFRHPIYKSSSPLEWT